MYDVTDPSNMILKAGSNTIIGATGVETFTIGSSTYAIVAGYNPDSNVGHGVRTINVSDPTNLVPIDTVYDDTVGKDYALQGATDVDIFTIGTSTYAIIASKLEPIGLQNGGVQIIDDSDPTNMLTKDKIKKRFETQKQPYWSYDY